MTPDAITRLFKEAYNTFPPLEEVARCILADTKKRPQDRFDEVDWEHLDLAMSSKSDMYKIWRSKQHRLC
jgi:hypothetical protein